MNEQTHDTLLTCQELVELVTDYREGALPLAEQRRFEAHLAVCPPCVEYVKQIDLAVRAAGGLTPAVETAPDTQTLLHLFRNWKSTESQNEP